MRAGEFLKRGGNGKSVSRWGLRRVGDWTVVIGLLITVNIETFAWTVLCSAYDAGIVSLRL